MKRFIASLLALVMIISMTACSKEQAAAGDSLSRIKEKGTIVIGLEGDWAPWSFHVDGNALVGFDTEVGQKIAEKLGVKAEIVEGEWDGLFAGIDAGRYDLVINGVEISEDRAAKYDFSDPYAFIRTALIVREEETGIQRFEDLKGKTTANSIASTYMVLAESYGATVSGVDTLDETIEMVLQGRVDATLNAEVSYLDYLREHPDAPLKIVAVTEDASNVCIPMKKGTDSDTLREAVNKAIKELREEGILSELSVKYFGSDITNP